MRRFYVYVQLGAIDGVPKYDEWDIETLNEKMKELAGATLALNDGNGTELSSGICDYSFDVPETHADEFVSLAQEFFGPATLRLEEILTDENGTMTKRIVKLWQVECERAALCPCPTGAGICRSVNLDELED